jgi:transcriptional regulator with XRE-family HTH domain
MSREPDAVVAQRRQLGAALATFRKAAEQSQAQLGTRTRYDRTSINKIEHGQQLPDRPFWQAVDKLLHANGALLKRYDELVASKREHAQRQRQSSRARHQADAARLRCERAATPALLNSDRPNEPIDDPEPDPVLSAPWSRRGTVEAAVALSGDDSRVKRRVFLSLTGTALTAPAHQWLVHEPEPLMSGLSGRRVSAGLVDRLTAMIAELRRMDDVAGGGSVLSLAQHEFGWVAGLLDRASYTERTSRALHVALAELGQLCGWTAYDAGHHGLAQRYYLAALRATHSADDRPLGAHVLCCMAEHAARQGQPAEAVTLIETALAGTRGRQSPSLLAELHNQQAYAFATLGDTSGCTVAISQARTQIERLNPTAEPSWLYWVNPANMTAEVGNCLRQLGHVEQAAVMLEDSIAMFDATLPRGRLGYLIRLADTLTRPGKQRDLDTATALGIEAVQLAEGLDSVRSVGLIRNLYHQMQPHAEVPAVREFLDRARGVLAT